MLTLPASVNHTEVSCTKDWTERARANQWQINCSELQSFDSSALALLLDLRRSALAEGATLGVHQASAQLLALATLYDVNDLLTIL